MIIGKRQARFDCAKVPEIKHQENTNIKGYETIVKVFEEALMLKRCYWYKHKEKGSINKKLISRERKMYNDCLRQTIHFLNSIKALKPSPKLKSIELWKDIIQMNPFYEGINAQLKSMLIKHHCPHMHKEMSKGRMYSHQTLTDISEAVLYLMEYFTRENLFRELKEIELKSWGEK